MTDKVKIFGIIAIVFLGLALVSFVLALIINDRWNYFREAIAERLFKTGLFSFILSVVSACIMLVMIVMEA